MKGFAHLGRGRAGRVFTTLAVVWFGLVIVPPAQAADAVLVGAGDIAGCTSSGDSATIVAGTGGDSHYPMGATKPNSQVRNANTFGVLKLTLHAGSYDWRFLPQAGKSFSDSGHGACHGRP